MFVEPSAWECGRLFCSFERCLKKSLKKVL
nr:MAG TPA: hypothetical protein [Caudoviricetes sp.]